MNNSETIKRLKNEEPFTLKNCELDLKLKKNSYDKCVDFWSIKNKKVEYRSIGNIDFGRKFMTVFNYDFGVKTETKIPYENVIFKTK